ncbi:MAG: DNA primase [Candidatus Paceibacterota bacterium]
MADSSVDEIKSKLSIEEVVGQYLQLQKAGRNLKACCPFHSEKSPSFMVSPERQSWHCFGCNEGGDIFTFVMKMEGLDFVDALKLLADKAGVQLKKVNYENKGEKSNLLGIVETSKQFYRQCLKIKGGKKAYEYLRGRGLTEEMIEKFELGFAPDSWSLLSDYLKKKGFTEKDILGAGMTVKNERGRIYDRFRGRIMFPVNIVSGQTVGFSSRIMPGGDESSAKYINTPETLIYNKGRILYGLDKSKIFIRQKDCCVLVEGNVDVIASFQAGVNNVVATCGTALTIEQVRIIKRYTDNLVFALDMDGAGTKATRRGIYEMALSEGMNVGIIQTPEGKDPADCVKKDPQVWKLASEKNKKVFDFYLENALSKYDRKNVDDKKKIFAEVQDIIIKTSNPIERDLYARKISDELEVESSVINELFQQMKKSGAKMVRKKEDAVNKRVVTDREYNLQKNLLGLIAFDPSFFPKMFENLGELFRDEDFLNIYSEVEKCYRETGVFKKEDLEQIKRKLADKVSYRNGSQNLGSVLDSALFGIEAHSEEEEFNFSREVEKCILNLREIILKKELKKIEMKIKEADRNQDAVLLEKLMNEQVALINKLQKTEL